MQVHDSLFQIIFGPLYAMVNSLMISAQKGLFSFIVKNVCVIISKLLLLARVHTNTHTQVNAYLSAFILVGGVSMFQNASKKNISFLVSEMFSQKQ
jgi:hypothetical protein